jgi:hypothetical protein
MRDIAPAATKIMIIRHAEKPVGSDQGVQSDGATDPESLIVQGWQRAGALACLFAPTHGPLQNADLAPPQFLYASEGKSQRPQQTVAPLAAKLGLQPTTLKHDQLSDLVESALAQTGVVLICWQHEDIPSIANLLLGNQTTAPQHWPGDRFDLVWIFDLDAATGAYQFSQVPQLLLAGDLATPIT